MKFGANTFLFTSRFTSRDTDKLEQIRDIGFSGVEVTLQEPGDFDIKEVKEALTRTGLECCSFCGLMIEGRDLRGTEEEQRNAREFITLCIDQAAELECGLVSGPLYSTVGKTGRYTNEQRQEQLKQAAGNLEELCGYGENLGVALALEPLLRFETDFINTCAEALELVEMAGHPNLGIHLDTFHMNVEETNPATAVLQAGQKLFNIHAADNHRGAPGTGAFNWKGFADAVKFIHYDRYIILESFHPDVPDISYAAAVRRKFAPSNTALAKQGLRFLQALF